jgi:hypothetical protein
MYLRGHSSDVSLPCVLVPVGAPAGGLPASIHSMASWREPAVWSRRGKLARALGA